MSVRELRELVAWTEAHNPPGVAMEARLLRHLESIEEPARSFLAALAAAILDLDERLAALTGSPTIAPTCENTCGGGDPDRLAKRRAYRATRMRKWREEQAKKRGGS